MRTHRRRTLKTEMVTFRSGAESIVGFLALPGGCARHCAVIAIHEWWGLNDWVKRQAANLAANGYVVIAVDLYRRKVTDNPSEARKLKRALTEERAIRDMKAAFHYLAARPDVDSEHIGSIGWSIGGGFAIQLAIHEPRLAACVVNYGPRRRILSMLRESMLRSWAISARATTEFLPPQFEPSRSS